MRVKKRLPRDRPATCITLRIPVEVVDSLKAIAPHQGYAGHQPLLKSCSSEGLRRDEAIRTSDAVERVLAVWRECAPAIVSCCVRPESTAGNGHDRFALHRQIAQAHASAGEAA